MLFEEKLNDKLKEGIEIGENRLADLAEAMDSDGRMSEFKASLRNRKAMDDLYREYNIIKSE